MRVSGRERERERERERLMRARRACAQEFLETMRQVQGDDSIPEVCVSVKRGLPYGKRGLFYAQKRHTDILAYLRYALVSKEACVYGKRDLMRIQKRSTIIIV